MLPPLELGARLDRFLACAGRLLAALPLSALDHKPPQCNRSVRDLAFHVFRLSLGYVDGMDMGELRESWLQEKAPPDLVDGPAVARYGALVRGRVAGWFEGAGPSEYARTIEGCYGPQNGHDLLERTTSHAARHLRQLYALAADLGVTPPGPPPTSDFEGLPLPASIWYSKRTQ
ncbi:MAG: DinB family protein [Candidatus Rokubacteria bacterium]|nr:DinB family protein [Candidatus Rokubacteria bacterium]